MKYVYLGIAAWLWYGMVASVIFVYPAWRIFFRAGLSRGLALLIFIPYIGIPIVLYILALSSWPNVNKADAPH